MLGKHPKDVRFVFPVYQLGTGAMAVYLQPDEKNPLYNPYYDSDDPTDKVCYNFMLPSNLKGIAKRSYALLEDISVDDERLLFG